MSASDSLKIAICQMTSVDDANVNLQQMETLLFQVQQGGGAQVAFFPENCLYMRIKEGEKISGFHSRDEAILRVEALAKKYKIDLHLGSIPLHLDSKLYNCSLFVTADGVSRPTYRKTHLFDIELEGQLPIRESDVFTHGEGPKPLQIHDWNFGQTICYDLRFAELFHKYALQHVDVILVPAAFLVTTGQAHWEVLLRARAIESQAYVVAAAQAGAHQGIRGGVRETYGRSLLIDPWGKSLWEGSPAGPEVKVLELSRKRIEQVRRQIPMKNHRRV